MAEINSEVDDIFQPTPVSLKNLSAIAVSLEIWRCEVMKYRTSDDALEKFDPASKNISSKSVLPDLPSVIYAMIDKYIPKFGLSMGPWLRVHHKRVFNRMYNHQNHILRCFENFVCDFNGTIHYVRTAERMMHCDQFDEYQKFIIACTYFLEDDIRRLWPFVSSKLDLKSTECSDNQQLYYWICRMKTELDKIPTTGWWGNGAERVMFNLSMTHNRPSVQYFWDRLTTENRGLKAYELSLRDVECFARYILSKLDDQTLDQIVNAYKGGFEMMFALCRQDWCDKEFVISVWMRIQNVIRETVFTNEIIAMLHLENWDDMIMSDDHPSYYDCFEDDKGGCIRRGWLNMGCEIWNSAPKRLKRSAVREIISNNRLNDDLRGYGYSCPPKPKEYEFFSTFFSCATYEERKTFWSESDYWIRLILDTRCEDSKKIMNLLFENEDDDEATQFKENVMANNCHVRFFSRDLLIASCFDELNDWASFLFSKDQAARNFKQQLLQENFIDRFERNFFYLIRNHGEKFNQFIDDAYANADLSGNFKNQLMSLPSTQQGLSRYALEVPLEELIELKSIDAFVSAEDTLQQIKARIINALKVRASADKFVVSESSFTSVLSWCLGSDEEVEKFKTDYL